MAELAPPSRARAALRILTAVPLCDGHDSAVTTINLELAPRRGGHLPGLSSVCLGHRARRRAGRCARHRAQQRQRRAPRVLPRGHRATPRARRRRHSGLWRRRRHHHDCRRARDAAGGVDRIFFAGTPLAEIVATIRRDYALQRLANVARARGNVFAELLHTVAVCSLGQITACLTGVVGTFRPMV